MKKYGLVFTETTNYIGDIPDKNICDIENFKWINPEDRVAFATYSFGDDYYTQKYQNSAEREKQNKYYICCPIKDVNMEGKKLEKHIVKKEIPDPIVVHEVQNSNPFSTFNKFERIYVIITKWGIEANDIDLQIPKLN